ncbi:coagulation factor 5/8 type domain-containing protein [Edaphobacter albus]|uniref:coagulation factor 5/8 type domain-containing protein n=1 Tax=Edaphobacter sp. 4G125 TaxID=2763071 RepID=UPI0016477534|nr:coagulation factor 5/8 type domain-containing protein [Edaphobacter sp. 4G125]QNI36719.1 coagulation factor 5/8 type domain-containing protein [Edaphobacter sp. 4G125]
MQFKGMKWGVPLAVMMSGTLAFAASGAKVPDLGPNVAIFSPSTPATEIQARIDKVYAAQQHSEFGAERDALLFLPGEYKVDVPVGFYTQVVGLGAVPDKVHIAGNVHSDAAGKNDNATTTFWRSMEGFSVTPANGLMQWAVSQAAPFRRMHVKGDMVLNQKHGWSSGGWMSDTAVDGTVNSGTQQQWISRNVEWGGWTGSNWNMVFVGVNKLPAGEWPSPPYTKVATVPVVREKPFLEVDAKGRWGVRVPALRRDSTGVTWRGGETPGKTIPLTQFYIAKPSDSATAINAALAKGKHLLLTPGIYELDDALRITKPGTVVLGLGFATLKPVKGTAALTVADVDGVTVAGLLFDAGETESPVLLEVGTEGNKLRHTQNPTLLADVFFRIGGAAMGKARVSLLIHSNDVIVDHTWIWRADHGHGVGWNSNTAANGLVVEGKDVTAYGLFVEHFQQYQVLWKGEGGRTYFYQSEIPYDPPTQPAYTSGTGVDGWASYKVADGVAHHEAWGLGIYSVFRHPDVRLTRAIEVPKTPDVKFHHMITVALDNLGSIDNVINDAGGPTSVAPHRVTPKVTNYP